MSGALAVGERLIMFVARSLNGESLRAARALSSIAGVRLIGVCEQLPEDDEQCFAAVVQLANVHDAGQLIASAKNISSAHGELERIVSTTETLLEPVAVAGAALGLEGMSADTVRGVLDKSRLKATLELAGIKTARASVLTNTREALQFAGAVNYPIVLKPLRGSGGLATWCICNQAQLAMALDLMRPALDQPVLAEEYLVGQEFCFDTIAIAGEPRFHAVCRYRSSILHALEDESVQWSCVMLPDTDHDMYGAFIAVGLRAVRALAVGNAMTHMEGFLLPDGEVRFTDATLRPAGARISAMLAFAYDIDPYQAWARATLDGWCAGPRECKYAVGTIFLRAPGSGLVTELTGVETMQREIGALVVDSRLPVIGAQRSITYTGDGYVTVRHPEAAAVEAALDFIGRTVRVAYSNPEQSQFKGGRKEELRERLGYFDKQLNRPAWDDHALKATGKG